MCVLIFLCVMLVELTGLCEIWLVGGACVGYVWVILLRGNGGYGSNLRILKSEFRNDPQNHKSFYILVITNLYPSIVFHSLHSEKKQVHWVGFSSSSLMCHIINGTKATHACCGFNLQNVIGFWSFTFNSSSSRYSIGEFV